MRSSAAASPPDIGNFGLENAGMRRGQLPRVRFSPPFTGSEPAKLRDPRRRVLGARRVRSNEKEETKIDTLGCPKRRLHFTVSRPFRGGRSVDSADLTVDLYSHTRHVDRGDDGQHAPGDLVDGA